MCDNFRPLARRVTVCAALYGSLLRSRCPPHCSLQQRQQRVLAQEQVWGVHSAHELCHAHSCCDTCVSRVNGGT